MITDFKTKVEKINPAFVHFDTLETVQVNLGNICNLQCTHCHVQAGPQGTKVMTKEVMDRIIDFLKVNPGLTLDITGGSPEMNPHFRYFLECTRPLVSRLMVRTNLTILSEKGMEWIPEWFRTHDVVVIASLPCYTEDNVNKQRGNGVFKKSIEVLKKLNSIGYGTSLELNLVYNPGSDYLPENPAQLEQTYKDQLLSSYGIVFTRLYTITNVPLGRFKKYLIANGKLEQYLQLLADNFNPAAAENIMCRTLVSIDYRGRLYNCDFNQALDCPLRDQTGKILTVDDLAAVRKGMAITTAEHCYCCTAGCGSSCTGSLA